VTVALTNTSNKCGIERFMSPSGLLPTDKSFKRFADLAHFNND